MSNHSFKEFINLIEHDQLIRQLNKEMDTIKHLQEVNNLDQLKLTTAFEEQQIQVDHSRIQLQELEAQMKKLDDAEKNSKKLLEQTSSSKEYQAIKKEIVNIQQRQNELEDVLLAQWNQFESKQKMFSIQKEEYEKKNEAFTLVNQEYIKTLAQLHLKQENLMQERVIKEKNVPMEWLEKYSHMRVQTVDPVVPVVQNSCSSCFYFLSDPELIKLKKMALVQCKGCFRLLYLPEVWNGASTNLS